MSTIRDDRGRRLALHPGVSTLSPKEAQEILRERPHHSSQAHAGQGEGDRKLPISKSTDSSLQYPLYKPGSQLYPHTKHTEAEGSSLQCGKVVKSRAYEGSERSACRDKLQKSNNGDAKPVIDPPQFSDDKFSRKPYSQNSLRRHSTEITENIPTLSEIAYDDSLHPLRGHKTIFTLQPRNSHEVSHL